MFVMINTVWAIVKEGKIQPLEEIDAPEGTRVLITLLPGKEEKDFWLSASKNSLDEIWADEKDNVYAELLEK
jgi:predicted DNA-binding antitoxin AbrB/MazE fold protein